MKRWVTAVAFAGLAIVHWRIDFSAEATWIENHSPRLALWRLVLIGALVIGWPWLVAGCARLRGVREAAIGEGRASRWYGAIGLLVIELVLVQAGGTRAFES